MANTIYSNFFLSNEVEDQFNSHLNLEQFCTIDRNLEGTAGMQRKINRYSATNGTEKLTLGQGNTRTISVSYTPETYTIQLAQNRFEYNDEEVMTDPMVVPVGVRHGATDMYNTVNADIYAEYLKSNTTETVTKLDFDAFVDAAAKLNVENLDGMQIFAFINAADTATLRKNLKDDLKYVEAFARSGYVGTVAGINVYTKKDATQGTLVVATKDAVTLFVKKGAEVEQSTAGTRSAADANVRKNTVFSRKYYLAALTDETKCVVVTGY